jgi:hypothetical protein
MDAKTLPAIVAGLDLDQRLPERPFQFGGRFIAMTRILTQRPADDKSTVPPRWYAASKQSQLSFLTHTHTPRAGAVSWLRDNPQVLAAFAAYTRKALPKLSDQEMGSTGVAAFAAAWNQIVYGKLSNDDLFRYVKTCLESTCN